MTIGSAAIPVVTSTQPPTADAAIPVAVVTDGRAVNAGPAQPVYVVTAADVAAGWRVKAQAATPVVAVTGRPVGAGRPIPVFVVAGSFAVPVTAQQAYINKVAALSPIAYWPLATDATDASGNGRNGVATNVTFAAAGPVAGSTAATFVAASASRVNVYSASLAGAFSGAAGTIAGWFKVSAAGVWSDATTRVMYRFGVDASNQVRFFRTTGNNVVRASRHGSATQDLVDATIGPSTAWFHLAMTWSEAADQLKYYVNGAQSGSTQTTLGVWAGALNSISCVIGASTTAGTDLWSGDGAHVAVWATPLTAPQIASIASAT